MAITLDGTLGITTTGNVTANYFLGNGSQLSGISSSRIFNGTSEVNVGTSSGNVNVTVGATSNVAVFSTAGLDITGSVSATGNVSGQYISATENLAGSNVIASSNVTATGNVSGGNLVTAGAVIATANVSGGNLTSIGLASITGNVTGGNLITPGSVTATGNITGGNLTTAGIVTAVGNVTANYFIGNGSQLTGIDATAIQNGTANVRTFLNGNVTVSAAGTANVVVITAAGTNIAGTLDATGNITGGNLSGTSIVGTLTTAAQTNITSVGTLSSLSVTGNISGGNLSVTTGTITLGNVVNGGSNGVGNIGSSTTYFNTVFAKATSAQYADLAEMYVSDSDYLPGTVVVFGGPYEVSASTIEGDVRVAGVVSTNPSYLMNATCHGQHVVPVAMMGRVPTWVTGPVRKGDMMIASANGRARSSVSPALGSVIGKALEDFDGDMGIIEVVVGRV